VDVPILDNKECGQWYQEEKKAASLIVDSSLCAGLENGGKDACQVRSFHERPFQLPFFKQIF
jgi:hypothetical protein